jgi:transposase
VNQRRSGALRGFWCTEGQITRLKLIKRQIFGRATHDVLLARILQAA